MQTEINGKLRAARVRLATEQQVYRELLAAKNESERQLNTLVGQVNAYKISLEAKKKIHSSNLKELSVIEKRIQKMEQEIRSLTSV